MYEINQLSITEIEEKISVIENLNLRNITIEEIKAILEPLFTGYTLLSPIFEEGLILYRGIKYPTRPNSLSFLSYPAKQIAKINRASRVNESMFYAATTLDVPFFELDVRPGDKLVISKWRTTKKLLVNHIGYTQQNFYNLKSDRANQAWSSDKQPDKKISNEKNILVGDFLARTFSQPIFDFDTDKYKLTIAIAEKHFSENILENHVCFDGLLYPTIRMKANADNLAITPTFIDSGGLEFLTVEYIEITGMGEFKYESETIAEADSILAGGLIDWKERIQHWTKKRNFEDLTFNYEDGKWIARDDDGNIVEPD